MDRAPFHSNSTGAAHANAALARWRRQRGWRLAFDVGDVVLLFAFVKKRADHYMAVWRNSDFQVVRTCGCDPFATPGGLAGSVQGDKKAEVGCDMKFGKLTCGESLID